jgi:hypothetical protein
LQSEKAIGTELRSSNGETVDAEVWPEGSLEVLSQVEAEQLRSEGEGGLYFLLKRCILAVLNSGAETDDALAVKEKFRDFEVGFIQQDRGLKLTLKAAPAAAFDSRYCATSFLSITRFVRVIASISNLRKASLTPYSTFSAMLIFFSRRFDRKSSFAGAGMPSVGRNTTTRKRSATNLACGA